MNFIQAMVINDIAPLAAIVVVTSLITLYYYLKIFYADPARSRTQHDCHHDTKVKPEAATAIIELLMMSGRTPETC
jgi:NADH:ubiquinone oxidoreductase subunit 2 (subunit N)